MPPPSGPPARPPVVDVTPRVGSHRSEGVVITVSREDDDAD
ncbi:hypothetical protein [Nonomuraea indica]|uniref:Uncharacterized protein n=1 Tax=Nonomuraea indica TaxID=1581193 RepID=A0ABW8ADX6_9ACTN